MTIPPIDNDFSLVLTQDVGNKATVAVSYNHCCNDKKGTNMANIIKKKEIEFNNGFLHHEGVIISPRFTKQYIELEYLLQKRRYRQNEGAINDVVIFSMEQEFDGNLIEVPLPKTPRLDKQAKLTDRLAAECNLLAKHSNVMQLLSEFNDVVEFVASKNVVVHDEDFCATCLDTPMLGNPLTLTKEKLLGLLCEAEQYPLAN